MPTSRASSMRIWNSELDSDACAAGYISPVKIYTKRGDAGQTDLFGGDRVGKDALRVAAYGEVDELNATLGVALATGCDAALAESLQTIQSALFDLGASLATPDPAHRAKAAVAGVGDDDVEALEALIDRLEEDLEPLKSFILPGGSVVAAQFHVSRTVCRRAERAVVRLIRNGAESVDEGALRYLNRLSDLLFVMARHENARLGFADVAWSARKV
jgi:cob(I)alamin adenosyltransferase